MDRRDRPPPQRSPPAPGVGRRFELGGFTRRLAVDQAARPFRIEAQDPIADDLKPDAADPRASVRTAAVIDLLPIATSRRLCPASFEASAKRRRSEASEIFPQSWAR